MLRCVLFLCLSVAATGLDCDWLDHFSQRTHACLIQLQQMGAGVDMTTDIRFPNKLYNRISRQNADSQLVFVQESLRHIFHLYRHGNLSCMGWDVERFLSTLHSQMFRLHPCVPTNKSENVELSKYYGRLLNSTMRSDGSLASWQKINHITRIHLYRLNNLVLSIRWPTTRGPYGTETEPANTKSKRIAPEDTTDRTAPKRTTRRRYNLHH